MLYLCKFQSRQTVQLLLQVNTAVSAVLVWKPRSLGTLWPLQYLSSPHEFTRLSYGVAVSKRTGYNIGQMWCWWKRGKLGSYRCMHQTDGLPVDEHVRLLWPGRVASQGGGTAPPLIRPTLSTFTPPRPSQLGLWRYHDPRNDAQMTLNAATIKKEFAL